MLHGVVASRLAVLGMISASLPLLLCFRLDGVEVVSWVNQILARY